MKRGFFYLFLLLGISALFWVSFFRATPMSLAKFQKLVRESATKEIIHKEGPWYYFRDFDKLLATLEIDEVEQYEGVQRGHLTERTEPEDYKIIEAYDLKAFKRAYPHLAPAFRDPLIKSEFHEEYHVKYSYGWKRKLAWSSRQLVHKLAKDKGIKLKPVFVDFSVPKLKDHSLDNPNVQGMLTYSFHRFTRLALCDGYKPAVMDLMRMARVEGKLTLSAPLSYMLMLRARQKNIRLVYEDKWLAEIDAELSTDEKKKYQELMSSKDKLRKDLWFCSRV